MGVCQGRQGGKSGGDCLMDSGLLFGVMKMFWKQCLCDMMTVLKATKLYTFQGEFCVT